MTNCWDSPTPGTIRELKSIIELAAVMCSNEVIDSGDIMFYAGTEIDMLIQTEQTMRAYNTSIIKYYLGKYNNDVTLVSQKLDIGRPTIYKLIKTGELVLKTC
jgi:DNA-binding NtrC family response regulator